MTTTHTPDAYFPADDEGTEDTPAYELTSAQRLRRLLRDNMRERNANRPEVYVLNRHVSRSGMLRRVSVFVSVGNELADVTRLVADVTGWKLRDDPNTYTQTLAVHGAGMDMHFHTAYTLGRALYPNGTTDHRDGGYMVKHVTL